MESQLEKYKVVHDNKLSKIYYLILYFFIFAFLGWILESLYSIYELGHFTKRGFLYGPICPIYGYGAIMLITFLTNDTLSIQEVLFKTFVSAIIIIFFMFTIGKRLISWLL